MSKSLSVSTSLQLCDIRLWTLLALASVTALSVCAETAAEAEHKPEAIALWAGQTPVGDGKFVTANATITVHRPAQANGAAIMIFPGGGYGVPMWDEWQTQALQWLAAQGMVP